MSSHPHRRPQSATPYWQWTLVISLGMLIAVTSFAAGILAERDLIHGRGVPAGDNRLSSLSADTDVGSDEFARLREIHQLIEREYYGVPTDPDELLAFRQELENRAIQGMMQALDGHSAYLLPVEHAPISERMSGEYEGIGVWVESSGGKITIVAPMPGSPAESAGLRAGDIIEAADGRSLAGVSEQDALALVRGPAGTTVRLTIRRPDEADLLTFDVVRQRIPMPAVLYRRLPAQNLALIQVTLFGDKTTTELDEALARAKSDKVAGIILDLRNNGGGWVQSAQEVIGRFVPAERGPALYEDVNPSDPEMTSEPILNGGETVFDLPLVVLVNGGTASASEIVAGALRDYGRAILIGEPTFGKGSVQRVHEFDDGASARITFAVWLTPSKHQIQGQGLMPDIQVAGVEAAGVAGDPQLERAIHELQRQTA